MAVWLRRVFQPWCFSDSVLLHGTLGKCLLLLPQVNQCFVKRLGRWKLKEVHCMCTYACLCMGIFVYVCKPMTSDSYLNVCSAAANGDITICGWTSTGDVYWYFLSINQSSNSFALLNCFVIRNPLLKKKQVWVEVRKWI